MLSTVTVEILSIAELRMLFDIVELLDHTQKYQFSTHGNLGFSENTVFLTQMMRNKTNPFGCAVLPGQHSSGGTWRTRCATWTKF